MHTKIFVILFSLTCVQEEEPKISESPCASLVAAAAAGRRNVDDAGERTFGAYRLEF